MAYSYSAIRQQFLDRRRACDDAVHAVVDEIDFTARQLLLDSRSINFKMKMRTTVWMASRSLGGVSMTDMSRSPSSDMCRCRDRRG